MAIAWNPLLLIECVANAHNEPLVMVALVGAATALCVGRGAWAAFALGCGAMTKVVPALLLPLWAVLDRSLSRRARRVLWAAPLLYLLAYGAMGLYGEWSQQAFGAGARLANAAGEAESPNGRLNIWLNALALVPL